MYIYKFEIELKGSIDPVKVFENSLNESMHSFGFSENIEFPKRVHTLTASTKTFLSEEEIQKFKNQIITIKSIKSAKYVGCDVEE